MKQVDMDELDREVELVAKLRRDDEERERERQLAELRAEQGRAEALVARFGPEIRAEVARGTYVQLFGSPRWQQLRALYGKLDDKQSGEPAIPPLRICWKHELAFFESEPHDCRTDGDGGRRRYHWTLAPLSLDEIYSYKYMGGYRSLIACFSCWDELGALEVILDPSVHKSRAHRQAELILCSVRLLAAIADGSLVDIVAADLRQAAHRKLEQMDCLGKRGRRGSKGKATAVLRKIADHDAPPVPGDELPDSFRSNE